MVPFYTAEIINRIVIEGTTVIDQPDDLVEVGKGRSAVVFKFPGEQKVLKVFFPAFLHLAEQEAAIYRELDNSAYYPQLFEEGEGYLILEYLEGITFYDCLVSGVKITEEMLRLVDEALNYARGKGLNPSDTHLQNVMLLHNGGVRVIDVVRFRQAKICTHWEDLKYAYYKYYLKPYFPKKYPKWVMETIIWLYRNRWIKIKNRK
ncbi:serine/threonine protein kinase [Pseudalkalibacillus hwajinpoensis]|uniref:serine/threonine protein kinase n=1 Tax=Guptibacillus hwajinpoensis TaxID=208199 RepID=UPI00325BEA3E